MDRFVLRTRTWQTLNYSSMAAQSLAEKKIDRIKNNPGQGKNNNQKKPLQPKQLSEVTQAHDFGRHVDNLFTSTQIVNTENINGNSNDSGLSSASSVSPRHIEDENFTVYQNVTNHSPYKIFQLTPTKNNLGRLIFNSSSYI